MNPSYCRIRLPRSQAIERFAAWRQIAEIGPLALTGSGQAVRLACDEHGRWRGNALVVSEVKDWTLFQDLSGALGGISAEAWRVFAGQHELIFAGYNDAIPYAAFVMVRDGRVVREFLDDLHEPTANMNLGLTDQPGEPFQTWDDVARFVDDDDLGFSEAGLLWVWND